MAGVALVGCIFGIAEEGPWKWIALPCLAALSYLALRRTVRTDRALAQSQEEFRQLIDLPAQATWVCDPTGTMLYIGERWSEMSGQPTDVAKHNWIETIHPEDRDHVAASWAEALASGRQYDLTYRVRVKDGSYCFMRARAFPQRDESGTIVRWIGQMEDVHDKWMAEEQLRQTAGLLEMIGSSTDSIIWAKDRTGRMLYINKALERLAGITLADVLGKLDSDWNPNPAEAAAFSAADRRVLESGISDDTEEAFTGHAGQRRLYRSMRSPLRDHAGKVVGSVGIATDVTERRMAEEREMLLARELDHRAKNLLAVVQSVVSLTRAETLNDFKMAVEGRIQSLGRAHSMLAASRWEGAGLERVLSEELAPYRSGEQARVQLSGPALLLKPSAAQSLALVIHELATNAVKYGALSVPAGELHVHWAVRQGDAREPRLVLRWEESGGPPVAQRSAGSCSGFGSRLIRSSIERQLAGTLELDWAETGLIAVMEIALDRSLQDVGNGNGAQAA